MWPHFPASPPVGWLGHSGFCQCYDVRRVENFSVFFIFYFLILTLKYTNVGGPSFLDHQLLDSLSYFLESWAESRLRPASTQGPRKDAQYGQQWEEGGYNSQTSVTGRGPCQETLGCHEKGGNRTSFRL